VSTLAGSGAAGSSNGVGVQASFNTPLDVAISRSGTFAVASERGGSRIRFIDLFTSQVTTLAGSGNFTSADGQGTLASFSGPEGVAISPDDLFALVVEWSAPTSRLRHIVIATGVVTTLAGSSTGYADGVGTMAKFNSPSGVVFSPDGAYALITDQANYRVRRLDLSTAAVTTLAGSTQGYADGIGTNAQFYGISHLAVDPTGSYALICERNNHRVRRLDIATSRVLTLAGSGMGGFQDGVGTNAILYLPTGVSIDPTGTYALIADLLNQRIRRVVIATAEVTTLAGTGTLLAVNGLGAQASFFAPCALKIAVSGVFALVAEAGSHRIRRIDLSSLPCSSGFYCPAGSSSPTANACPAGFYCVAGSSNGTLLPCTLGSYCPSSSNASNACPAGSFCANPSSIEACLPGAYCPARSTATLPCAAGSFCSTPVIQSPCSGGFYCGAGSSTPTQYACAIGTYCPSGSVNATACARGSYCPLPSLQIACPAGSACNTTGMIDVASAVPCPPMTFSAAGSSACSACAADAYSLGSASTCVSCGACAGTRTLILFRCCERCHSYQP
jgi:DNA-binding beta-propeller fold protein YncE